MPDYSYDSSFIITQRVHLDSICKRFDCIVVIKWRKHILPTILLLTSNVKYFFQRTPQWYAELHAEELPSSCRSYLDLFPNFPLLFLLSNSRSGFVPELLSLLRRQHFQSIIGTVLKWSQDDYAAFFFGPIVGEKNQSKIMVEARVLSFLFIFF